MLINCNFNVEFWINQLKTLDYPLDPIEMDIPTLREQKVISSDILPRKVLKLTSNDFVEIAILEFDQGSSLTRSKCTKTTRSWKSNRLIKPLLIFTNGTESFLVIVPGKGVGGEAKILGISEKLYHTDKEVLESIRFPGTAETLNENYDATFFPYGKVRTEFFEGYKDLFQKIEDAVQKLLGGWSSAYAQRFLGRLMFLYFLQKKGWLQNNRRYIDGIKDYRELNILFYESLNTGNTPGIPFLNGSLFEKEDYLNSSMEKKLSPRMDALFKESRNFFNLYNFTTDEATPLEVEVSIDPALIGTVFENMLPEYERGSKGTFYTPRVEISFICRRALVNWLGFRDEIRETLNGQEEFHDGLQAYIKQLWKNKSEKEVRDMKKKLLSLVILDPAVGSGGFTLGMMQEIIQTIHDVEETVGWKTDPEELKLKIMRNIYGFDIEAEAIEISRLRLWISLIIDQKEPIPLPNLDMNFFEIKDSLIMPAVKQISFDSLAEVHKLRDKYNELKEKYLNEHHIINKNSLRSELVKISNEIRDKTGIESNTIESHINKPVDIIIMNPPYLMQEEIPSEKKNYYSQKYGLNKKSNIYAYFMLRALNLLSKNGIASIITADKWLESDYGIVLQQKMKKHIIAIYGQKERTFDAEVNTVIIIYAKESKERLTKFTYIEKYGLKDIRRNIKINTQELTPGKWFYMRTPKIITEKILPKLKHRLDYYVKIKFGIKTGANDFFYLKDVSNLYEIDFLTNTKKFIEWGVKTKTREELETEGLIYVENESEERFIIDRKDISQVIRRPSNIDSYLIEGSDCLVFKPNPPKSPGKYSLKYIKWGEKKSIKIKRGRQKGNTLEGYHRLESIKSHKPKWYNIPDIEPSQLLHPISTDKRHFVAKCSPHYLADQTLVMIDPKENIDADILWMYLNSTVSYVIFELYGRRLGAGNLVVAKGVMESIPVPNLSNFRYNIEMSDTLSNLVLKYDQVLTNEKRQKFDIEILKLIGIEKSEKVIDELYNAFIEIVNDRLIKSEKGR